MFINGLAEALRARGLGVMLAGRRVPLFMYADDMIMLAATQNELAQMNAVASEYARQHRFQFNGGKSAVMAFGVKKTDRARADARGWRLGGEPVPLVDSYVYLGTTTVTNPLSWTAHVGEAVRKAKRRSADHNIRLACTPTAAV